MDDRNIQAYRLLKQKIFGGAFRMGERLIETRLAEETGLSRTPIRAALGRLASEGFLEHESGRSHRMPTYSVQDVQQIYNCRALVEAEAVRLTACNGLAHAARLELDALVAGMGNLVDEPDELAPDALRQRFLVLNHRFHAALYEACGNPYLLRLIHQVTDLPLALRNYFNFSSEQLQVAHSDHVRILDAVKSGESERAAGLLREHIWAARDRMLPPPNDDLSKPLQRTLHPAVDPF